MCSPRTGGEVATRVGADDRDRADGGHEGACDAGVGGRVRGVNGPYSLNVIPPVALAVAPVNVAVSLIALVSVTESVESVVSVVQLLIDTF